jgi:hypothetical protein
MATLVRRKVRLEVEWDKLDPSNFKYRTVVWAAVADDSEPQGEKEIVIGGATETITRTAFRALTGQQIENNAAALANATLQTLGSGAESHTIVEDDGD